ncbi:MAG: hypothetical protein HY430_01490 [Candidatus Levybacteria bacterium]|nr:hypothetical protein [Candidatus Levybacteria bacterium]
MVKKNNSINLLRGQEKGFLDKFLDWALSAGRAILIVTEIIALSAFLYRFSLDRELVDLNEKIKNERRLVELLRPDEEKFRALQARLALIKNLDARSEILPQVFDDVHTLARDKITINSIVVSEEAIKIDASTKSVRLLSAFLNDLKQNQYVNSVSLDVIENRTSVATYYVGITVTLKQII